MVAAGGVTSNEATGTELIVIVAVAVFPSTATSIRALPAPSAVTIPSGETRARSESGVLRLAARPARRLPDWSRTATCNRTVSPTDSAATAGSIATVVVTGGGAGPAFGVGRLTVTTAAAELVPLRALSS